MRIAREDIDKVKILQPVSIRPLSTKSTIAKQARHIPNEVMVRIVAHLPYISRAQLACTSRIFASSLVAIDALRCNFDTMTQAQQDSLLGLELHFLEVCERPVPYYFTHTSTTNATSLRHPKSVFCKTCGYMGRIEPGAENLMFIEHLKLELDRLGWICSKDVVKVFWVRERALEAQDKAMDRSCNQSMLLSYRTPLQTSMRGFPVLDER